MGAEAVWISGRGRVGSPGIFARFALGKFPPSRADVEEFNQFPIFY